MFIVFDSSEVAHSFRSAMSVVEVTIFEFESCGDRGGVEVVARRNIALPKECLLFSSFAIYKLKLPWSED